MRNLKGILKASKYKLQVAYSVVLIAFVVSSVLEWDFWFRLISGSLFAVIFAAYTYAAFALKDR